jgi:hypothetical protein
VNVLDFLRGATAEDRFAKRVLRRVRDRGWSSDLTYDRERFAIVFEGDPGTLFLHNVYKDWAKASAADKETVIERSIAFVFEPDIGKRFEDASPFLLPVIRNRADLENQWLEPALKIARNGFEGALRPFCDDLAVAVAIDTPAAIKVLYAQHYTAWSRTFDDVLPIAIDNLRAQPIALQPDERRIFRIGLQ